MKVVHGVFNGAGAALKLGIGFVPFKVKIWEVGHANKVTLEWHADDVRKVTGAGGIVRAGVANTPSFALLAVTAGVRAYYGGEQVAAVSAANQISVQDIPDKAGNQAGDITSWKLGSADNRTGNFNAGLKTAVCGVGSLVEIGGVKARILALTNDGDAANEVTLDRAVKSGKVNFIGAALDYDKAPVGTLMPQGFEILDTTHTNAANTMYAFEAYGAD